MRGTRPDCTLGTCEKYGLLSKAIRNKDGKDTKSDYNIEISAKENKQ